MMKLPVKQHQQVSNTEEKGKQRAVRPAVGRVGRVGTALSERKVILGYYADAFSPQELVFRVLRSRKPTFESVDGVKS
jgi:hypothetical protein